MTTLRDTNGVIRILSLFVPLSLCLPHMTQVLSRVCPGVGKMDSTYFPSSQPVFLKLQPESESPGGLVKKNRLLVSNPRVSNLINLG